MEYIRVTEENIEKEHICCAMSGDDAQSKKDWLKQRFSDGMVFLKANARGKCFIEYVPAEFAFAPVIAPEYMYIDCLWVSGQFSGHGYSRELLDLCIKDSKDKGKCGLAILSSAKKRGFLADKKYLTYMGFTVCDTASPDYELMYLPFSDSAKKPQFAEQVKAPHIDESGYVIYYSNQCPFPGKYVPLLQKVAEKNKAPFKAIKITTSDLAKKAPSPVTVFSLFYNGELVTHEVLSEKKFEKLITEGSLK